MATTFRKDRNFEAAIRRQPEFNAHMRLVANEALRSIIANAPRRTGYYVRSLSVVGTAVVSNDPFAHLIEWGSANNPAYAPMRRGVLAIGLRLDSAQI